MIPSLPPGGPGGAGAVVGGPALVYGDQARVGDFVETFLPGAFDLDAAAGFAGSDGLPGVQLCMYHDADSILASVTSRTMAVTTDARELGFIAKLPASAELAAELVATGVVACSSIGFAALDDSWSIGPDGNAHREVRAAHLFEISGVPMGAYPQSKIGVVGGQMRSASPGDRPALIPGSRAKALAELAARDTRDHATPAASRALQVRVAKMARQDLLDRVAAALAGAHLARGRAWTEQGVSFAMSTRVGARLSTATQDAIRLAMTTLQDLLGELDDGQQSPGPRPTGTAPAGTSPDDSGVSTGDVGQPYGDPASQMGADSTNPRGRRSGARLSQASRDAIKAALDSLTALLADVDAAQGVS